MHTIRRGTPGLPAASARGCSDSSAGSAIITPAERRKWRRVSGVFIVSSAWRLFLEKEGTLNDFVKQRTETPLFSFHLFNDGGDCTLICGFNNTARRIGEQIHSQGAGEDFRLGQQELFEFVHIGEFPAVGHLIGGIHGRA